MYIKLKCRTILHQWLSNLIGTNFGICGPNSANSAGGTLALILSFLNSKAISAIFSKMIKIVSHGCGRCEWLSVCEKEQVRTQSQRTVNFEHSKKEEDKIGEKLLNTSKISRGRKRKKERKGKLVVLTMYGGYVISFLCAQPGFSSVWQPHYMSVERFFLLGLGRQRDFF